MRAVLAWIRQVKRDYFSGNTPGDVAAALERFLAGNERKWDWDDYFAVPTRNPVIRSVTRELYAQGFDIPPDERWRTEPELRVKIEEAIARLQCAGDGRA